MKRFLPAFLYFFFANAAYTQGEEFTIRGEVFDAETMEPLPFVNILIGNSRSGTTTDLDGRFKITSTREVEHLHFSFIGYEKQSVKVTDGESILNIGLIPRTDELEEVTVMPGENPAHRIIKNAVANKKLNDPESRESFSYKTYNKFVLTLNTDSMDFSLDTVEQNVGDSSYTKIDSSDYWLGQFLEKKHFFFMESVTERKFLAPSRDNETVLASRTSGFKNPLFSLVFSQMQSFSFYNDYINIAGGEFLNPLTPGSTSRYFFILEDTTYNSPTDTVFVVSFRPRPNYGFNPMEGILYISSHDWALQNVIAWPYEDQEVLYIKIQQQYRRFGLHSWFPVQLNADLRMSQMLINGEPVTGRMRTYLQDIRLNDSLSRKDISRANITIADKAATHADDILNTYRIDSLSNREAGTYHFLDSIGEAENFERKLKIISTIATGKIPVYFIDIDIDKLLGYNVYEGTRLGFGAHTNSRLLPWFRIGGYFGYGLRDKDWKYGWDAKLILNKYTNLNLIGGFQNELFETGGVDFLQRGRALLLADNYRQLFVPQWDKTNRYWGGITYDILPKLHGELRIQHEDRRTIGNYYYQVQDEFPHWQNGFQYSEIIASFRYSPREKYVEGPGFGKLTLQEPLPIIFLQYTQGVQDLWNSDFSYNKIDARLEHQIKTVRAGIFSMGFQVGVSSSPLPFSKLYAPPANLINGEDFWEVAERLADRNSFETMFYNEFLSDRYVQFFFRQDLKSLLFRYKSFSPHIELVTRMMWGGLEHPEVHHNITTRAPEKGYFESGIELNRLLKMNFMGFGIGAYYRYGAYAYPEFEQNLSLKLTSKFGL